MGSGKKDPLLYYRPENVILCNLLFFLHIIRESYHSLHTWADILAYPWGKSSSQSAHTWFLVDLWPPLSLRINEPRWTPSPSKKESGRGCDHSPHHHLYFIFPAIGLEFYLWLFFRNFETISEVIICWTKRPSHFRVHATDFGGVIATRSLCTIYKLFFYPYNIVEIKITGI